MKFSLRDSIAPLSDFSTTRKLSASLSLVRVFLCSSFRGTFLLFLQLLVLFLGCVFLAGWFFCLFWLLWGFFFGLGGARSLLRGMLKADRMTFFFGFFHFFCVLIEDVDFPTWAVGPFPRLPSRFPPAFAHPAGES